MSHGALRRGEDVRSGNRQRRLAAYLCWVDYPQFAAMHLQLDRTETIAQGGQRRDFRVSRGRPVHVEPEFLHA